MESRDVLILCLTILAFMVWVIDLKDQIHKLKTQNDKLMATLKKTVKDIDKDVEISSKKPIWGKGP